MEKSYGERVLDAVLVQCEARNIPVEEIDDFLASVEATAGTAVTSMNGSQLKSFQQNMDGHFRDYLGGSKRKGGDGDAWGEDGGEAALSTAKAGLTVASPSGKKKK